MNIEEIRTYCLNKKEVTEGFPFNDSTLVFKVAGKIFALLNLHVPHTINLKCDPGKAIQLREKYAAVQPGYHMNKKYWNTVSLDDFSEPNLLRKWIDHSYHQVVEGLPASKRKLLQKL
jgi:predicted DNA-binding protein (MmcQ/YjbR family)